MVSKQTRTFTLGLSVCVRVKKDKVKVRLNFFIRLQMTQLLDKILFYHSEQNRFINLHDYSNYREIFVLHISRACNGCYEH